MCSNLNFVFYEAKPTLPANFEDDTWAKLKSAINAIFLKQPVSCDLENLYQVDRCSFSTWTILKL